MANGSPCRDYPRWPDLRGATRVAGGASSLSCCCGVSSNRDVLPWWTPVSLSVYWHGALVLPLSGGSVFILRESTAGALGVPSIRIDLHRMRLEC
eukprot:6437611-Pyramimonas_sp.AAC.1